MPRIDTIRQFVLDEFLPDVGADEIDADYDLLAGGVIDSLELLKVIAWIDDRFGVSVDDVDLAPDDFRSIAAIDSFVERAARDQAGAR